MTLESEALIEDLPLTDDDLADAAETMAAEGRRLLRFAEQARIELTRRLVERQATHLETERWTGVLKPGPLFHGVDGEAMMALKEYVPADVWAAVYVQPKPPEPRWDQRVLNDLIKLGGQIKEIIDGARTSTRGEARLELKRKAEA